MQYRPEIDGLRALAVLPVMLFHAGFAWFGGGYVGVDVFFVISGYLITAILLREKAEGRFTLIGFYERRARRILPALFVVMAACLLPALLWMPPTQLRDFFQSCSAVALFVSNVLFWVESGYFEPAAELKPLLHTWSLAVEEQFYVAFPLFLMLAWRLGPRRIAGIVAAVGVLSLALSEWGWRYQPAASFYLTPMRAWELAIGALLAFAASEKPLHQRVSPAFGQAAALLGLGLVGFAVFAYDDTTPFPSVYALVPTLGTALIVAFARGDTWVGRFLSLRPLVGIGLISYSAYLWHQPMLAFARLREFGTPPPELLAGLCLASLGLAYLTWLHVEIPFRDRRRFSRPAIFGMAATASAVMIGVGTAGDVREGFPGRLPPAFHSELDGFEALRDGRESLIRAGLCHYSEDVPSLEEFLAQWRCLGKGAGAGIIVVGDSHAADKAGALRSAGLEAGQLTAAGCSVVPSLMTFSCQRLFDSFLERVRSQSPVRAILLSNKFRKRHLTRENAAEMRDYWKAAGVPLVVFTSMPQFPRLEEQVAWMAVDDEPLEDEIFLQDFTRARKSRAVLSQIQGPGVAVVDMLESFCSLADDGLCSPLDGDDLLLVDYSHLSPLGSRLVGEELLREDAIRRLLPGSAQRREARALDRG